MIAFGVWAALQLNSPWIESMNAAQIKEKMPEIDPVILEKTSRIPYQLTQLHDSWLSEAIYWRHLHYVLATASIALSALVASGSALLGEKLRNLMAVLAAISTGMLTTMTPYKTYEDLIGAWRIVNVAKLEFLMNKMSYEDFAIQTRLAENTLRESRQYQQSSTQHSEPPKSH